MATVRDFVVASKIIIFYPFDMNQAYALEDEFNAAFSDGYVTKTLTVPVNVTALPALLEDKIVVRVSMGPVVEYVPIPTSQLPVASNAE
jgi:hypothetical protein